MQKKLQNMDTSHSVYTVNQRHTTNDTRHTTHDSRFTTHNSRFTWQTPWIIHERDVPVHRFNCHLSGGHACPGTRPPRPGLRDLGTLQPACPRPRDYAAALPLLQRSRQHSRYDPHSPDIIGLPKQNTISYNVYNVHPTPIHYISTYW